MRSRSYNFWRISEISRGENNMKIGDFVEATYEFEGEVFTKEEGRIVMVTETDCLVATQHGLIRVAKNKLKVTMTVEEHLKTIQKDLYKEEPILRFKCVIDPNIPSDSMIIITESALKKTVKSFQQRKTKLPIKVNGLVIGYVEDMWLNEKDQLELTAHLKKHAVIIKGIETNEE